MENIKTLFMNIRNILAKSIICLAILTFNTNADIPSTSPDLIVINADIRTSNRSQMTAESIAIKDGKFYAIGDSSVIIELRDENTIVVDAEGKTILPGFIDSHTHLSSGSKIVTGINLTSIQEKSLWLEMIAERVKTMEPGEWLLGGRWDHTFENKGLPTRWELDNVAPNNPVALSDIDGHSMWVNSLAIEKAKIKADSEVPLGGQILLDQSGLPNGILLEGAMEPVSYTHLRAHET